MCSLQGHQADFSLWNNLTSAMYKMRNCNSNLSSNSSDVSGVWWLSYCISAMMSSYCDHEGTNLRGCSMIVCSAVLKPAYSTPRSFVPMSPLVIYLPQLAATLDGPLSWRCRSKLLFPTESTREMFHFFAALESTAWASSIGCSWSRWPAARLCSQSRLAQQ